jgi:hypothetical protein
MKIIMKNKIWFSSKNPDNNIKNGRKTCFFNVDKNISLEWSLKFAPLNLNICLDGCDRSYTFKFWFIWVFYLSFNDIFKYYPSQWNSCINDGKGGYINSGTRYIGISQYDWSITIYIWHDGDGKQLNKDKMLFYKYFDLKDKIVGTYCYYTIEEEVFDDFLQLPEHKYKIKVYYRYWHLKYKRFPFLNRKGVSVLFKSKIKISGNRKVQNYWVTLKDDQDFSIAYDKYLSHILKQRTPNNWVPQKYKKEYYRKQKLERILSEK